LNYYEASIVIEEFAFREELSLKRYIRTDVLLRQVNAYTGQGLEKHCRNKTAASLVVGRSGIGLNSA
jgi:hypothetical protein